MEAMDSVTTTEMAEVDPWAFPANLTARDVTKSCQHISIFEPMFVEFLTPLPSTPIVFRQIRGTWAWFGLTFVK